MCIGDQAPVVELPATDRERYRLADFAEADVLTVFFICTIVRTFRGPTM